MEGTLYQTVQYEKFLGTYSCPILIFLPFVQTKVLMKAISLTYFSNYGSPANLHVFSTEQPQEK